MILDLLNYYKNEENKDINKKYELTDETIKWKGYKLYRIKALKDFGDVKKGDLGGWIRKEQNLTHRGDCWVYNNAKVYGNALILRNARIYDNAEVHGSALISDYAKIYKNAKVYDNAIVKDNAIISDYVSLSGNCVLEKHYIILGFEEIKNYNDLLSAIKRNNKAIILYKKQKNLKNKLKQSYII